MKNNLVWLYGDETATLYENITDYEVNYDRGYVKFIDEHGNNIIHVGNFTFIQGAE
jgi:hypothetical protein